MDVMIHARRGQFFDDHYDTRPPRPPPVHAVKQRKNLQSETIETMQSEAPANSSDYLVTRVALSGVIALQMFP